MWIADNQVDGVMFCVPCSGQRRMDGLGADVSGQS